MTSVSPGQKPAQVLLLMKMAGNRKIVGDLLSEQGYDSESVLTEQDLTHALGSPGRKMALVDVTGFGPAIWGLCEMLRYERTPFLVMSTPDALEMSSNALSLGAVSVVQKPIAKAALLNLLDSMVSPGDSSRG